MGDDLEDDWELGAENFQVKVSLYDSDDVEDEWESPCNGYVAANGSYLKGRVYPSNSVLS